MKQTKTIFNNIFYNNEKKYWINLLVILKYAQIMTFNWLMIYYMRLVKNEFIIFRKIVEIFSSWSYLIQSNLSSTTTLGTSNLWPLMTGCRCLGVSLCYRYLYCKMVAIVGRWSLSQVWLYLQKHVTRHVLD